MCCREAQAAELARAERALEDMQRTGLYRPLADDEAAQRWEQASDEHRRAIQAYTQLAQVCCRK